MIPTQFICTGNKEVARGFIGLGRKLIGDLKNGMSYNKFQTGKSGPFFFENKKLVVNCDVNFGITKVHIHYVPEPFAPEEPKKCLCYPHFAMAMILAAYPASPTSSELRTDRFTYDIAICAKYYYILYEGAYDANFGRYSEGQVVLATIGEEMSGWTSPMDCDRTCLTDEPRFDILAISPIISAGMMTQWREDNGGNY